MEEVAFKTLGQDSESADNTDNKLIGDNQQNFIFPGGLLLCRKQEVPALFQSVE